MSIQLPNAPTQNPGETLADFDARHLRWWREGDMAIRVLCHNEASAFRASIETNAIPTLNQIADAWDAFDVRLGALAAGRVGRLRDDERASGDRLTLGWEGRGLVAGVLAREHPRRAVALQVIRGRVQRGAG